MLLFVDYLYHHDIQIKNDVILLYIIPKTGIYYQQWHN